jgi:hypothetical protein
MSVLGVIGSQVGVAVGVAVDSVGVAVAAVAVAVWQGGSGWMTLAVDVTGVFEWSDLEQYWPRYVCFGGSWLAGGWQWLGGSGCCGSGSVAVATIAVWQWMWLCGG